MAEGGGPPQIIEREQLILPPFSVGRSSGNEDKALQEGSAQVTTDRAAIAAPDDGHLRALPVPNKTGEGPHTLPVGLSSVAPGRGTGVVTRQQSKLLEAAARDLSDGQAAHARPGSPQ